MGVIGLLTDYGLKDSYVARIKGRLAKISPSTTVIDVSHDIQKFHLPEAAYILGNVWRDFPKGTVFLVGVEHPYEECDYVICETDEMIFVAPNNGVLSLLFGDDKVSPLKFNSVYEYKLENESSFSVYEYLLDVVAGIIEKGTVDGFGESIEDIKLKIKYLINSH